MKFISNGPINNTPALIEIMAWRWPGDKPLSEPMMVSLLTHICVTRPQWVKVMVLWWKDQRITRLLTSLWTINLYMSAVSGNEATPHVWLDHGVSMKCIMDDYIPWTSCLFMDAWLWFLWMHIWLWFLWMHILMALIYMDAYFNGFDFYGCIF